MSMLGEVFISSFPLNSVFFWASTNPSGFLLLCPGMEMILILVDLRTGIDKEGGECFQGLQKNLGS